jgi:large subunit ribosomal protein L17
MIKNHSGRKLSKIGSHRRAMFANMITSLIMKESIITTNAKAKELRRFFDRMMNYAKDNKYSLLKGMVRNKDAFKKVINVLVPRFKERNSGYTTLINVGYRKGDNTLLTMVKLVE